MDEFYMNEAYKQAEKSSCSRIKVGIVIVKDGAIIAQGYNNVTGGLRDCRELGCLRDELGIPSGQRREVCRAICAEQIAITEAARNGVSLDGGTAYLTTHPCFICSKMLASVGIREIIYANDYPDEFSKKFLLEAGIKTRQL
jgi:dCMP deaminase